MQNLEFNQLIEAMEFAAVAHQHQRRKGCLDIPYINHPIKVANLIQKCGISDIDLLVAAVLHDVVEDTDVTLTEVERHFGAKVAGIVDEVTDDMSQPSKVRKQMQIDGATNLTINAARLKIADKTCNIRDIIGYPLSWSKKRKLAYVSWSEKVVGAIIKPNPCLLNVFFETVRKANKELA